MDTFSFKSKDFGERYGHKWLVDNPKANILIFEGMEEYSARYDKFAKELNKKGYSVYSLDTFGQGENAKQDGLGIWPKQGFIKQVDIYGELASSLRKENIPLYIFSHSMGSFMGQSFLIRYPNLVDKICLCGSGGKNPILGLGHFIARMVVRDSNKDKKAKLLNNLMFKNLSTSVKERETDYDWLSYNKDNVKNYIKDPLCGFGPTNGFCLSFIQGMRTLYKKKNLKQVNIDTKIFLIGGEEDPVTGKGKFTTQLNKQYIKLGCKDVSYKIYPHMRHEILNEDNWLEVSNDVINFFSKD